MYKILVETLNANSEAMNNLAEAIKDIGTIGTGIVKVDTETGDIKNVNIKGTLVEPAAVPTFATTDAKRAWLVEQLTAKKVEIPDRTRTTTLEKMYLELMKTNPSQEESGASSEGSQDSSAPDLGSEKAISKTDVTAALKAYVMAGADTTEQTKRKDEIKAILTKCGAPNVSELDPKYFEKMIAKFKV